MRTNNYVFNYKYKSQVLIISAFKAFSDSQANTFFSTYFFKTENYENRTKSN